MNFKILRFDSVQSTNTEAANQARQGADEGLCIIAREQFGGRGRHGRTWVSAKDSGLYFSVILRPKIELIFLPLITLMAGVAVHDTLKGYGLRSDIKWVNDILVGEKKICGILAETIETANGPAVIVGIGINLTNANFPEKIADTATSIKAETRKEITGNDLAAALTPYLSYFYGILSDEGGSSEILRHWRRRSSYFSGKSVLVTLPATSFEGITDGLEESGALRVIRSDGSVTIVQAGDVERLREV